jgi:hypothetical protein
MSHWETPGASNEWYTPAYVFEALGETFDTDVAHPGRADVCCVPATRWITANSLEHEWSGFVWMNPPFGERNAIMPWLDKFFLHGNGIALTPDRTSAPWFQDAWRSADAVLFTRKIRFLRPDGTQGISPSNGTALMAAGERGTAALHRAASAGLGILATPQRVAPLSAVPELLEVARMVVEASDLAGFSGPLGDAARAAIAKARGAS